MEIQAILLEQDPEQCALLGRCTYKDYLNCGPLNFNGTEGVIGLTRWFERTESVSSISNCTAENQVKFAFCTLIGSALTWWNSYMKAVSQEVTYTMHWKTLSYTLCFQELALLCGRMFPKESDEIERYVGRLPEMIRGNVMSCEPKSMQKAIEFANDQMDQKLLRIADRSGEKKPYGGTKTLCPKCNFHHDGPCGPKCTNCKMIGHIARDCRSRAANTNNNNNNNNYNNRRATAAYQGVPTCFEGGAQGHFKNNCLKLGNRIQGNQNQAGNGNAVARAYGVGTAGRNPNANVVTSTFLLSNRCASILFNTGADKSFVSTAFSSLININPSTLDYSYDVELAYGQIIGVNTVIRGLLALKYCVEQWKPNDEALRKCSLSGPYKLITVLVHAVEATDDSPAVPEHTTVETPTHMSPENKAHFLAVKEAIHLILTGIGDDIYSTVDACQTAQEMWKAIERLQQGESLNNEDVKTNLFWEFGKFTSHDGESMESYYTRFYKLMNEMIRNNLTVTTMQQYQNEVNELRAEKLARNANPLALAATAQASQDPYYQLRSHISSAPSPKPLIPSRSQMTTRHKGKEIAKPITPPSKTASKEDSDPEQAQRDKDIQKNLSLIAKYFKKIYKPTNNNLRCNTPKMGRSGIWISGACYFNDQ
nr:hypothetical protein [Tanacetum cinerariifolium]